MPVTLAAPYCEETDLLLGDIRMPNMDIPKYIESAADEIDSKLGYVYELPLTWSGTEVPRHEGLLLKSINVRLATGRLLMAAFTSGEDRSLHAYGKSLIDAALADLMCLANGDVDISAGKTDTPVANQDNLVPGIVNHDSESLLDGFENSVMRGVPWYSRPGQVPINPWP